MVFALVGGGFAHAMVPHDEGDHHSSKEIVWNMLHASLSHEQKYLALLALTYLFIVGVALSIISFRRTLVFEALAADRRHLQLRRGTAAYRRFD